MHDADDDATRIVASTDVDDATRFVARTEAQSKPASSGDLAPGTVVRERFVIDSVLGRGGMGVVYRAKDLRKEEMQDSDPFVALKVLGGDYNRDPRMMMALQREARKAQSLAHPNIATVYDFDRDGEQVYITMEVLNGAPLNDVIAEHPQGLTTARARSITRGLCLGLAYAHNKGIVHSDFKPGNIFLAPDDRTRILDFGIARAAPAGTFRGEASATTQFDAGDLGALTPSYASCEMFEGKEPHPADDVFALAIVAYQLFSGRHPFDFTPAIEARRLGLEPTPIKGIKRREWRALKRGLAFERADRSGHAAEFLEAAAPGEVAVLLRELQLEPGDGLVGALELLRRPVEGLHQPGDLAQVPRARLRGVHDVPLPLRTGPTTRRRPPAPAPG
ncbi:MAG: serine/threonine protein kinase, partial [Gammaproteobacteria bacterium]|nr:serine/threonine protein kinase [Gammaproteobacteria bacterium]